MFILALTFAVATIPGITAPDSYPHGCVDCHNGKVNTSMMAIMKQLPQKVDPKLLAQAQAAAPKGLTLKGKHPNVVTMVKETPNSCLTCHSTGSKSAPPFAEMIHAIHLTGGEKNAYLTMFGGTCTYCHKFNANNGQWSMPSAAER